MTKWTIQKQTHLDQHETRKTTKRNRHLSQSVFDIKKKMISPKS